MIPSAGNAGRIGEIRAIMPMVAVESAKTFPKISPKPSSPCLFLFDFRDTTNSGRQVPTATTMPTKKIGSAMAEFICFAESVIS